MDSDESSFVIIGIAGVIALFGLALAGASLASHASFGGMMSGGMMGGASTNDAGPGGLEWGVMIGSAALFLAALFVFYHSRTAGRAPGPEPEPPSMTPLEKAPAQVPPSPSVREAVSEPTLAKLLDEDERRMYLEIRDHGGVVLQRDLVALGTFSKAKVTRVLDKLERKGLVHRERHGMTNRVRLRALAGK